MISRRKFLGRSAKAAAALAISTHWAGRAWATLLSDDEYEFIVIGSGAGGGPLAANLAMAGFRVLLIEAGGDPVTPITEVPLLQAASTELPEISWNYYVKHFSDDNQQRKDSKWVPNRGVLYPRAAAIGGCTVHNAMITVYPDNGDWQDIADRTGDPSWNPGAMRGVFEAIERCEYRRPRTRNPSGNGYDGWLATEQTPLKFLLKDKRFKNLARAAIREEGLGKEIGDLSHRGFDIRFDPNDARALAHHDSGVFNPPKATDHGARNGPREFIHATAAQYPDKLTIRQHTLVSKILFDESDAKRAVGVEVLEGAHLYEADPNSNDGNRGAARLRTFRATREVILAGGAFNSPQLLQLSGIGDPDQLARAGIPLRHALPGVGKNLQDRYEIGVVSELKQPFEVLRGCEIGSLTDPCLKDYRLHPEKSLYSSNGVVIALTKKSAPELASPDLFIFGVPGNFRGYYPGWSKAATDLSRFSWVILKSHTSNTAGTVSLRSKNPFANPEIEFRYFDEGNGRRAGGWDRDLEAVIEGVNIARRMNEAPFMKRMIRSEVVPGPAAEGDDLRRFVTNEAWGHHASCSNKMGVESDPTAVVDSEFRVHGIRGLRIVDASVFPKIPGMFIVTPIYMISEKASQVLIAEHTGKSAG